ncbi:MAG: hypothetical protein ACPGU1_17820 [Myxococcota bacterium]
MRVSHLFTPIAVLDAVAIGALVVSLAACGGEQELRSAGESCTQDDVCEANLCYASVCLEPAADDDLDGLSNAIEAQLKTDPRKADSDDDGLLDAWEVGSLQSPLDEDGDGLIDANESNIADDDADCIPDQKDHIDDPPEEDLLAVADKACCCDGPCSASGIAVSPASCIPDEDGAPIIGCPEGLQEDYDDDGVPDVCDLCFDDSADTCELAPHSVVLSPQSPSSNPTPTLHGVAVYAATLVVSPESCDGAGSAELGSEIAGTGGAFSLPLNAAPNATRQWYVRSLDHAGEIIGCVGTEPYTHDDVPPAPPLITETSTLGDTTFVDGASEIGVEVHLYGNAACEGEPLESLEVLGTGDFSINLSPPSPEHVSATATDAAGNVSGCSEPFMLAPQGGPLPGVGTLSGPYAGPTCEELDADCEHDSVTFTPGCDVISGSVSAVANDEGWFWTMDVCRQGDEQDEAGLIEWPPDSGLPVGLPMLEFNGEAGLTLVGDGVAGIGMDNHPTDPSPLLITRGPGDAQSTTDVFDSLSGTTLTERPVVVADAVGSLYSLGRVPGAPVDTLTLLVKSAADQAWRFAPGLQLPLIQGSVPADVRGIAVAAAPPRDLHTLLWRENSFADPMAYYHRLELNGDTVTSADELPSLGEAGSMELIPLVENPDFPIFLDLVVARLAVVREADASGAASWTPHVAHWFGDPEPGIRERLIVLRRVVGVSGAVTWETIYSHFEDNVKAQMTACADPPKGADDVCTYTLYRKRLLDLTGGERLRMLLGTYASSCEVTALCNDGQESCTWAGLEWCNPGNYGWTLKYQDAAGEWRATTQVEVADEPIDHGALMVDAQGTIHVVLSTLKDGVVKVRHETSKIP